MDYYQEALDNGWHVSPITCEYNNYINSSATNNFITTILCEDLSRSEILNAVKNRRIYVSENRNIDINFTLTSSDFFLLINPLTFPSFYPKNFKNIFFLFI